MKTRTMVAALLMLLTTVTYAQNNNGERRQRQRFNPTEVYTRMADRLAEQMKLDDDKASAFKVLYLDYQTARQNAANPKGEDRRNEQLDLRKLTDEQATDLIQQQFQAQEAQLAVDKDYCAKFLEILTPAQTAQIFVQRGAGRAGMGGQQGRGRGGNGGGGRAGGFGGGNFGNNF